MIFLKFGELEKVLKIFKLNFKSIRHVGKFQYFARLEHPSPLSLALMGAPHSGISFEAPGNPGYLSMRLEVAETHH